MKRLITTIALLLAMMLAAVACGNAGAQLSTADQVPCDQLGDQINMVKKDLDAAKVEVQNSKGTPNESTAQAKVTQLEAQQKTLEERKSSDACTTSGTTPGSAPTTTAAPAVDPQTGLPVVDGGDPANPTPGTDTNTNPATPPVRDGKVWASWTEANASAGGDQSYKDCASSTVPNFNWDNDVPKFMDWEAQNPQMSARFILVVNSTVSKDEARRIASDDQHEDLNSLDVWYVDAIINTRGFNQGMCDHFVDRRSMVRVSLGRLVYNQDGSVKGVANDGGIFDDCHNPWKLLPPSPERPTPTPTPTRPPTVTTVPPTTAPPTTVPPCVSGKCTPPTTTPAPPTTAAPPPTAPTTLPPGDSGPGAYNTIPPGEVPTTVQPPAPPPPTTSPPTSRVVY